MAEQDPTQHPDVTVVSRSRQEWSAWAAYLLTTGRHLLGRSGLLLLLGLLAGLGALALFGALTDQVLEQDAERLDNTILTILRLFESPELTAVAQGLSALGTEVLAVFLLVLLIALAVQQRWGAVLGLLLVTFGAQMLNSVLKELFHRTRPAPLADPLADLIPGQAFSFPSGHAMVAAAFYLFVAYLSWRLLPGCWRLFSVSLFLAIIGLIGLSRLYLGVHYLTDVVAGYLAGFFWTDAVIVSGWLLAHSSAARKHQHPQERGEHR